MLGPFGEVTTNLGDLPLEDSEQNISDKDQNGCKIFHTFCQM